MTFRTRIQLISAGYRQAFLAAAVEAHVMVSELAAPATTRAQRLKRLLALSPALAGVSVSVASFGLAACGADVTSSGNASQLVDLANNVAWFLIAIGLSVSLASFAYAGFLFATSGGSWHTMYTHDGGSSDRAAKGMKLAKNVLIGMGILVSGAVVKAILITVVSSTGKSVVGSGNSAASTATDNAVDCSGKLDTRFNTGG